MIIVGLGNPGQRYARTRHNVGFMVVEALARESRCEVWSAECQSLICQCDIAGQNVVLAKPLTFMNLSGRAVALLAEKYGLGPESFTMILDDLNLPFGKVRVRARGGAGGHHGLESVIRALGNDELSRVRLGIGEENLPEDKAEFVLSDFPPQRQGELEEMISRASNAIKSVLSDGVSRAMSVYNA